MGRETRRNQTHRRRLIRLLNRAKLLHFIRDVQSVPALRLGRCRSMTRHPPRALENVVGEPLFARRARCAHRGGNSAARSRDLLAPPPFPPPIEFRLPKAPPRKM